MTQPIKKWTPKAVGDDDRHLLYRSRELFYGARDDAFVDHLYFNNPAGRVYGCLAMDGEIIAGQYVIIPIDLLIDGARVKATLSLNTFTHSDYRRQGIFTGLAREVYGMATKDGSAMTLGIPNEKSRPGLIDKLSFTEPFVVVQSARPLAADPSWTKTPRAVLARLPWGMAGAVLETATGARLELTDAPSSPWLETLWERYKQRRPIDLFKDAKWVRWRYVDHPTFNYRFLTLSDKDGEPRGYAVWNITPDRSLDRVNITLMDVVAVDHGSFIILTQAFLNEIAPTADTVKTMYTPLSAAGSLLTSFGFIPYKKTSFAVLHHRDNSALRRHFRQGRWNVGSCYADFL